MTPTTTTDTKPRPAYRTYDAIDPSKYAGSLKGKVAIVTGTSVGIGRSIAKAFAASGTSVAAIARRSAEVHSLVDEIKASGGHAIPIVTDVSAKGAAQEIVAKVEAELGPIDILINNAGISRISPLDAEPEDLDLWWKVYEVNVRAPVALIRAVLPSMLARKTGVLISTGSDTAKLDLPVMSSYASSKAAISKFHESLSIELKDTGVLSFAVNPGRVPTELGKGADVFNKSSMQHPATQAFLASIQQATDELATPELCADVMVALAADQRYSVLTGRHVDATQELEKVVEEAEKEGMGRLGSERLYLVTIPYL